MVPQGCPANTITQQRMVQERLPANYAVIVRQIVYPVYSYRGAPNPNATVDVRLTNKTNVAVAFKVIGNTQRHLLSGRQSTVLQNIPPPSTITFVQQDDGFVEVIPVSSSQGLLALDLDEDLNLLDSNQGVIRIQRNGQVSLN